MVRHTDRTESQLLLSVITDALTPLGLTRADVDFTCLGSCDYITGQAFSFVSNIDAGNYWVYYYADSSDKKWEGRSWLCVTSRRFETKTQFLRQTDPCPAGYRLQGFREMTTNAKNHTLNLR